MKNYLIIAIFAVSISFTFTQISFAVCGGATPVFFCNDSPPNPDPTGIQQEGNTENLNVNVLPGASVDTRFANGGNGMAGIQTWSGNDMVDVESAFVAGEKEGLSTAQGDDKVTVTDSTVIGDDEEGIQTGPQNDEVIVLRSTIMTDATEAAIGTGPNDDVVIIEDSNVTSIDDDGIGLGPANDRITIINSKVSGASDENAVQAGPGDDTITLSTGAHLDGNIECAPGFDTIVFAMDVPEELVPLISSEIAAAGLPDGSVTINNLFYEWTDCELLVNDLNGVRVVRPIPTLSEWGLIAMAGIMGIVGILAVKRRKAAY